MQMLSNQAYREPFSRQILPAAAREKVMKRFYKRFKQEYAAFLSSFEGSDASEHYERYASGIVTCALFLHFVQHKGLLNAQGSGNLDGERNYLLNRLEMIQRKHGEGFFHTFYRSLLAALFSAGVEVPGSPELRALLGNVPYLTDEVFDVLALERASHTIHIPDEAFGRLFRFLGTFEWCLDDYFPRGEQALSPDIIDFIFEKQSSQKQLGTYYTSDDITEYISKSCIIPRIFALAARKCPHSFHPDGPVWGLLRADPEHYMYSAVRHGCALLLPPEIEAGVYTLARRGAWDELAPDEYGLPRETWREVVARRQRYAQLKTRLASGAIYSIDELLTANLNLRLLAQDLIQRTRQIDLLVALYTSLEELTILDPTCGPGAFLLAALDVLEPLYASCLARMRDIVVDAGTLAESEPERSAVQKCRDVLDQVEKYANFRLFVVQTMLAKNLYGVDIMSEATEICKLRLLCKLIAPIKAWTDLQHLSTVDFHIRTGNTLVGFANYREIVRSAERSAGATLSLSEALSQIGLQCREVEHHFIALQQLQRESGLQTGLLASSQKRLRALLTALCNALDRYLATSYGIDAQQITPEEEYEKAFVHWKEAFQPFHWMIEWYEIMRNGGFDVIIGNPPYVAYRKVQASYQLQFYETQTCGNLCAYIMERAATLLVQDGRCGMIVPVSAIASESYRPLSQLLRDRPLWISSYSNRPGKLFAGAEQRLAILLWRNVVGQDLYATAYRHWYEPERAHLFATLSYTAASTWEPTGMPLKSGSEQAEAIFARLMQKRGFPLLDRQRSGATVWVHNGPTYWVRALPFEPNVTHKSQRSDHYCKIPVSSQNAAFVLSAILSSSTFYFFYKLISNCRDLGRKELSYFPLGELQPDREARLAHAGRLLAESLKNTAEHRTRHYTSAELAYEVSYEEYYPARARVLLDEIDRILAEHYGFSAEELDFLLHYDLKYRLAL